MKQLVLFLAIIAFLAGPAAAVYGSFETDIKDYPHQASIERITNVKPQFIANGAVLSKQIIVTVASAIGPWAHPYDILVRVGSSKPGSGGEEHNVAQIIRNPSSNDVVALKLTRPIAAKNVVPVSLPAFNERPQVGESAFVSSWGKSEAGAQAPKLRQALMNVRGCECVWCPNINDSGSKAEPNVSATFYQAWLCMTSRSSGTCDRDEGAPLISKRGTLAGLASSSGFGCYSESKQSLFFDVSSGEIWYFLRNLL